MDIRRITDDFYAAPQIGVEDLAEIAACGIRVVLCNRPDEEVPPSHQSQTIGAAAQAAGLTFVVLPLAHHNMTPEVIRANHNHINGGDAPVLAYCASGTRSTIAWALGQAGMMSTEQIVTAAARGGYDLRNIQPTLEAIARNTTLG
ncbi:MAG: TIGR01244 family sulfur transferase [Pseudomonadota bacterium]